MDGSHMKNKLVLILTTVIASIWLITSCLKAAPITPQEPAATVPEPLVEIPPAELGTPNWIYAIIGIGAALAVIVTIYIIRSKKP